MEYENIEHHKEYTILMSQNDDSKCDLCKINDGSELFLGKSMCDTCKNTKISKTKCCLCKKNDACDFFDYEGLHYCDDCEKKYKCCDCGYIHLKSRITKYGRKKCGRPCF